MASSETKSAAELELEVDAQRSRVESTIGQIQERLSPGQMVDELLSYAKNSGGGDFVANLGRSVQTNPLPVALLGVSLLWLMAKPNGTVAASTASSDADWDRRLADNGQSYDRGSHTGEAWPYAPVKGSALRRIGHATDEAGRRYSEFVDEAGARFRGLSDEVGNRAGHFTDAAGNTFQGFTDEAGNRISDFFDEAGARLSDTTGWASHTWREAQDRLQNTRDAVGTGAARLQRQANAAGGQIQSGAANMTRTITDMIHQQPLVGGALAFAVGAAIASALPSTEQEDQLVGATSDQLKAQGARMARDAYETGKEKVEEAYEKVADKAADTYEGVKADVAAGLKEATQAQPEA